MKKYAHSSTYVSFRFLVVLCLATAVTPSSFAADDDPLDSKWLFSGFGSVGLARSTRGDADFVSTVLKSHGAGFSQRTSANVDSRIGAQVDWKMTDDWSAVLQVISELGLDNSYRPKVEWANLKYRINPNTNVRFGRISLPMFLAADYRKVGYAYAWARTPVEVYGSVPISNSDGIDASTRWTLGDFKNVTQIFYGYTNIRVNDTARAKARGLTGVSNTTDIGALSLRVSLLSTNLTMDAARPLFDGFRQFGEQGISIAERYDVDHKRANGISLGANYDPGNWFLMLEAGQLKTNSYLGDKSTFYASTGYRYESLTPYLAYAKVSAQSNLSDPGLTTTYLPPNLLPVVLGLNGGLNQVLRSTAVQSTVSLGLRWDLRSNAALKLQYDKVMPQAGTSGMLINTQADFRSDRPVHIVSAVLDFVF